MMQCRAPKIAKLVYTSNNYGLWYANNYSYRMGFINQLITVGRHIVEMGSNWEFPMSI